MTDNNRNLNTSMLLKHSLKRLPNVLFIILILLPCTLAFAQEAGRQCPAGIPNTTNDAEYEIRPNGEILHLPSNLIFKRCTEGQTWDGAECLGEPTPFSWQDALNHVQSSDYNDSRGWRLPNIKELLMIVERACVRPSINLTMFPNTSPDDFWTSSPSIKEQDKAWVISFANGNSSTKLTSRGLFIRLVRKKNTSD